VFAATIISITLLGSNILPSPTRVTKPSLPRQRRPQNRRRVHVHLVRLPVLLHRLDRRHLERAAHQPRGLQVQEGGDEDGAEESCGQAGQGGGQSGDVLEVEADEDYNVAHVVGMLGVAPEAGIDELARSVGALEVPFLEVGGHFNGEAEEGEGEAEG